MKRKLFIGSSKEGLSIATQLKNDIDKACGDWIETHIWKDGNIFSINKNALDALVQASRRFDYGLLVATKDDIVKSRGAKQRAPRDNVMLETGMFLGSLGLTRAFLLVEEKNKLPTDYNGVTVPYFNRKTTDSLKNAVDKIIKAIQQTKLSYNLKPVPSAALALGYFDSFILALAKKKQEQNILFKLEIILPKSISDIASEISEYANANPSTQISADSTGGRPLVNEYNSEKYSYWDIPTTLTTLSKLMDLLIPAGEIGGIDPEKQDWIEHELRNFKGTLEVLVERSPACRGKVTISYLP